MTCPHQNNGVQWARVAAAFLHHSDRFQDPDVMWLVAQRSVRDYHQQRINRKLPCDYRGCIEIPIAAVKDMAGARENPAAYIIVALQRELPREEKRQKAAKQEIKAQGRKRIMRRST